MNAFEVSEKLADMNRQAGVPADIAAEAASIAFSRAGVESVNDVLRLSQAAVGGSVNGLRIVEQKLVSDTEFLANVLRREWVQVQRAVYISAAQELADMFVRVKTIYSSMLECAISLNFAVSYMAEKLGDEVPVSVREEAINSTFDKCFDVDWLLSCFDALMPNDKFKAAYAKNDESEMVNMIVSHTLLFRAAVLLQGGK